MRRSPSRRIRLRKLRSRPSSLPLTPEREAAAITFVRQHHAELVDLLNQLKETKPAEYQAAIRELFQTSERLAQLREQDPQRYELELDAWKTKSRIRLLAARSTMSGDMSLKTSSRGARRAGRHPSSADETRTRSSGRTAIRNSTRASSNFTKLNDQVQPTIRAADEATSPVRASKSRQANRQPTAVRRNRRPARNHESRRTSEPDRKHRKG